jgi:hypothetical protein
MELPPDYAENNCVICRKNPATVLYRSCKHRITCEACHTNYVNLRKNRPKPLPTLCQYCDAAFDNDIDVEAYNIQVNAVSMGTSEPENGYYPYGWTSSFGKSFLFVIYVSVIYYFQIPNTLR